MKTKFLCLCLLGCMVASTTVLAKEKFYFSVYSVEADKDLLRMKKDGFTAIGPYFGDPFKSCPKVLKHSKTANLSYACGIGIYPRSRFHSLSLPELEKIVTEQILKFRDIDEISSWNINPEELRFWIPKEIKYLAMVQKVVKKLDPKNRPLWMYEPNNRDCGSLLRTTKYQDLIVRSVYPDFELPKHMEQTRAWCNWAMSEAIEAQKKSPKKLPVYAALAMAKDTAHPELVKDYARHDSYSVLLNGAQGIIIWSGFRRLNFSKFDDFFNAYARVASELNGELNLGQVFLHGKKITNFKTKVLAGPAQQKVEWPKGSHTKDINSKVYPSVNLKIYSYKGKTYLFAVNSAMQPVTIEVSKVANGSWNKLWSDQKAESKNGKLVIALKGLEVVGLTK